VFHEYRKSQITKVVSIQPDMPEACRLRFSEFGEVTLGLRKGVLALEQKLGSTQNIAQETNVALGGFQSWLELLEKNFGGLKSSVESLVDKVSSLERGDAMLQSQVTEVKDHLAVIERALPSVVGTTSIDVATRATRGQEAQRPATTRHPGMPPATPLDAVVHSEKPFGVSPRGGEPLTKAEESNPHDAPSVFDNAFMEKMAKFIVDQQMVQRGGVATLAEPPVHEPLRTAKELQPPTVAMYAHSSTASTARDIRLELEGAEYRAPPLWYSGAGGSLCGSMGYGPGSVAGNQGPTVYGPGSATGSHAPAATAAHVNVLGAGTAPMGYASAYPSHPIHHEVWKMMTKPRFSGQPHDYARFEAEWDELERAIRETSPYPPSAFALLIEFKACLDEATQIKLRVRMQQDPGLTLAAFKRELRGEFGVDSQKQHRRDWEAVVLHQTGPPERPLTLQNWRHFEAQYKLHREQVPERSAAEEWRMLFVKLPATLQEQIVREQSKRREKRPWVRIAYPPGLDAADVITAMEVQFQEPLPSMRECASSFIVETSNEVQRDRLLELHNARLNGFRLLASRHEYEMSGDEIISFITRRLNAEEELQATRNAFGLIPPMDPKPRSEKVPTASASPANLHVVKFSEPKQGKAHFPRGQKSASHPKERSRSSEKKLDANAVNCYTCRREGRPFVHDFKTCEHSKKAFEELKRKNPSFTVGECRSCARAGRPANHDFRKCEHAGKREDTQARTIEAGPSGGGSPTEKSE
jgi:hypothetical protein